MFKDYVNLACKIDNRLRERRKEKNSNNSSNNRQNQNTIIPLVHPPNYSQVPTSLHSAHSQNQPVPMDIDNIQVRRLTQEERNRRFQNNLCLYCGNSGHVVRNEIVL